MIALEKINPLRAAEGEQCLDGAGRVVKSRRDLITPRRERRPRENPD